MRKVIFRRLPLALTLAVAVPLALSACSGGGSSTPPSHPSSTSTNTSAPASTPPAAPVAGQSPTAAPPAGYQWVGSSTLGVWVAVPTSWVAIDLSKISISAALKKFSIKGVPDTTMKTDMELLAKQHALFMADLQSALASPHKFATNANAYCTTTAIEPGPGSVSVISSELRSEYTSLHVRVVSVTTLSSTSTNDEIRVQLAAPTTGGFTITEVQVADLTDSGHICFLTLSTDQPATYLPTFEKISSTLQAG
jgi:hypothetical protein